MSARGGGGRTWNDKVKQYGKVRFMKRKAPRRRRPGCWEKIATKDLLANKNFSLPLGLYLFISGSFYLFPSFSASQMSCMHEQRAWSVGAFSRWLIIYTSACRIRYPLNEPHEFLGCVATSTLTLPRVLPESGIDYRYTKGFHLLADAWTDPQKTIHALKWTVFWSIIQKFKGSAPL